MVVGDLQRSGIKSSRLESPGVLKGMLLIYLKPNVLFKVSHASIEVEKTCMMCGTRMKKTNPSKFGFVRYEHQTNINKDLVAFGRFEIIPFCK